MAFGEELWCVDFERHDDECVTASVVLDCGVSLNLFSEQPSGYREWEVEEVSIMGDDTSVDVATRTMAGNPTRKIPDGSLRRALDREFMRWAQAERMPAREHAGTDDPVDWTAWCESIALQRLEEAAA